MPLHVHLQRPRHHLYSGPQVGLQTMLDDGNVFKCHKDMWDAIFYSEMGSSLAILKSGFNLDSLMTRYQGIDWSDERNWGCNSRCIPCILPLLREAVVAALSTMNQPTHAISCSLGLINVQALGLLGTSGQRFLTVPIWCNIQRMMLLWWAREVSSQCLSFLSTKRPG